MFVFLFLLTLFFTQPVAAELDDSDELVIGSVLVLDEAVQASLGLKTLPARPLQSVPFIKTYGRVVDLTPLITFRQRCLMQTAQLAQAKAQFSLSQKALRRLKLMVKNKAAALRKLEQQQRQWLADKTQVLTAQSQRDSLIAQTRLNWGEALTWQFCQADDSMVQQLLSGDIHLLAIPKPRQSVIKDIQQLSIEREKKWTAIKVQRLAQTVFDKPTQTIQLLFTSMEPGLQTGRHFSVQLPLVGPTQTGIFVPAEAVVWHLGQAFVYIKTDAEHFERRNIDHYQSIKHGYLVTDGIAADEAILVRGAQILLSHEFRSQIPEEDDD